ncbi:type II CRISPR-associated endonuclease Cas1 [Xanthobacter autotrophicus]|uniref:type II CRISPR-associated endonuclease Cas1 n=1 Tax=Xanthobacter autotrophicus TaxID=280 RepID=UPI00372A7A76
MAWKGVHLSRPARLNTADGQIVVAQDDGEVRLPLEDIAYLVLDAPHATLTSTLLSACMEAGIVIVSVDARHTPNGIMLPFHSHHRQAGVAAAQLAVSEPFRKRCWQRIVVAKIENQAAHLVACGRPASAALVAMARRVGSGDPDNIEARAARDYWRALFSDFVRDDPGDLRNKLLNYGYAVVRAGIARALVAYGLLPSVGLNHASVTNAFNLADDLIEPFRPFVDRLSRLRGEGRSKTDDLTIEDRRAMAGILMQDCTIATETVSLLVATEKATESLVRSIEGGTPAVLALPRLTAVPALTP